MTPLEALQATLAAEHAAVYVYGVIGGRVSQSAQPALWERVRSAYVTHRGRRDHLVAVVRGLGEAPSAAEVSYPLPNAADSVSQLRSAARLTEERAAAVYADLVGSSSGEDRGWPVEALQDAAVRQLGFGGTAEPFPGVAEL